MRATLFALIATTSVSGLPAVSKRQGGFDQTWDDPFIPIPESFEVRNAGSQCNFQLAYERFTVDNWYDVTYLAEYPDGSQQVVSGESRNLATDTVWLVDGFEEARGLQVVFFEDICRFGAAPSSFRANFALRDGFTYENRWTTGSFSVTSGTLPATPQDVRVQSAPRDSTVTWSPVEGATGYVVLVEWFTDSEVGPLPFVWAREVEGTSFSYDREFTRAAVVALGDGDIPSGAKAFTALGGVRDVSPS